MTTIQNSRTVHSRAPPGQEISRHIKDFAGAWTAKRPAKYAKATFFSEYPKKRPGYSEKKVKVGGKSKSQGAHGQQTHTIG